MPWITAIDVIISLQKQFKGVVFLYFWSVVFIFLCFTIGNKSTGIHYPWGDIIFGGTPANFWPFVLGFH